MIIHTTTFHESGTKKMSVSKHRKIMRNEVPTSLRGRLKETPLNDSMPRVPPGTGQGTTAERDTIETKTKNNPDQTDPPDVPEGLQTVTSWLYVMLTHSLTDHMRPDRAQCQTSGR